MLELKKRAKESGVAEAVTAASSAAAAAAGGGRAGEEAGAEAAREQLLLEARKPAQFEDWEPLKQRKWLRRQEREHADERAALARAAENAAQEAAAEALRFDSEPAPGLFDGGSAAAPQVVRAYQAAEGWRQPIWQRTELDQRLAAARGTEQARSERHRAAAKAKATQETRARGEPRGWKFDAEAPLAKTFYSSLEAMVHLGTRAISDCHPSEGGL
jgi:hypothetical protein